MEIVCILSATETNLKLNLLVNVFKMFYYSINFPYYYIPPAIENNVINWNILLSFSYRLLIYEGSTSER